VLVYSTDSGKNNQANVYGINSTTGKLLWNNSFASTGGLAAESSPVINPVTGDLHLAMNNLLITLDINTGATVNKFAFGPISPGSRMGQIEVDSTGQYAVSWWYNGFFAEVLVSGWNLKTGALLWNLTDPPKGYGYNYVSMSATSSTAYAVAAGEQGTHLYAVNAASGHVLWQWNSSEIIFYSGSLNTPLAVYTPPGGGSDILVTMAGNLNPHDPSPVDFLYHPSIVAISEGNLLWRNAPSEASSTNQVGGPNVDTLGRVVFGTNDVENNQQVNRLYVLDIATGTPVVNGQTMSRREMCGGSWPWNIIGDGKNTQYGFCFSLLDPTAIGVELLNFTASN